MQCYGRVLPDGHEGRIDSCPHMVINQPIVHHIRLIVQEGVLYPALYRLEKKRLLTEEWGTTESGREAKYYSLTPAGRAHLKAETKRWSTFSTAINRALAPS